MKRSALQGYRAKRRDLTIALEWLWVALGFVLLAVLIAFTHLDWPLVLLIPIVLPIGLGSFVSDLRKGEMSPLMKIVLGPYRREEEPVAFWLSLVWNVVALTVMTGIVVASVVDGGLQP